eukprot:m.117814 g.117814  ORF g.117814 m.117814 type:complete len:106 (+) comp28606_c0_seq5:344-661(+)
MHGIFGGTSSPMYNIKGGEGNPLEYTGQSSSVGQLHGRARNSYLMTRGPPAISTPGGTCSTVRESPSARAECSNTDTAVTSSLQRHHITIVSTSCTDKLSSITYV